MKFVYSIFITLVLFSNSAYSELYNRCYIVDIKSGYLNVRDEYNRARVIGKAYKGSALASMYGGPGEYNPNRYVPVKLNNGRKGVAILKHLDSSYYDGRCAFVGINSGYLNVRNGRSTRSRIIDKAAINSGLAVLSVSGAWAKVRTNKGRIGYVATRFLYGLD